MMPEIIYNLPPGSFAGFTTVNGIKYPAIVVPPKADNAGKNVRFQYVELFADGKRIAYWCEPFQPHLYVIYEPEVMAAKKVTLTAKFYTPNEYPKP